jgi:hypothetical protein
MNKNTTLQECWIWNDKVTDFVSQRIHGYSLNCPSGLSKLGSVRADIDPKEEGIQKVDMICLPYPDNTFDVVIQDPPWKIGFYQRMKPFFECVRVCKVGGTVIYNAYWIPQSKYVKLKELFVRQDGQFTNTSIISVFEKIHDVEG